MMKLKAGGGKKQEVCYLSFWHFFCVSHDAWSTHCWHATNWRHFNTAGQWVWAYVNRKPSCRVAAWIPCALFESWLNFQDMQDGSFVD